MPLPSRPPQPLALMAFPFFPVPLPAQPAQVRAKHSESRPRAMQGLEPAPLCPQNLRASPGPPSGPLNSDSTQGV